MGVKRVQTCDMCGNSRELRERQPIEDGGWRRLPVRKEFGDARDEQPLLDPECLNVLVGIIDGYKKEEN